MWRPGLVVGGLIVLALLVRVKGLAATNLWLDEANSWSVARDSWGGLLANLRHSPVGPLYFILLKLWMGVAGDSAAALRSLSLVASLVLLPVTYALGVRILTRRAALFGVALLALSPLEMYFAQEARMYMLQTLFVTACALAYAVWRMATFAPDGSGRQRAVESAAVPAAGSVVRPVAAPAAGARRALALYVILGLLAVLTQPISTLLFVALNIDALLLLARQPAKRITGGRWRAALAWLGAQAVILVIWVPYLLWVRAGQAAASQAWRGASGVAGAVRGLLLYPVQAVAGTYFYPHQFLEALHDLHGWHLEGLDWFAKLTVVQPVLVVALVALLAVVPRSRERGAVRMLYLALIVPLAIGAVISVRMTLEMARYFLFVSPFLFLLLGGALARLEGRALALALVALGGALWLGLSLGHAIESRDSDYRPVAAIVERDFRAGDRIFIQPVELSEPLDYYLRHHPLPLTGVPAGASVPTWLARAPHYRTWVLLDYRSPLYGQSPDALQRILGRRVERDEYEYEGAGVRVVRVGPAGKGNAAATVRGRSPRLPP